MEIKDFQNADIVQQSSIPFDQNGDGSASLSICSIKPSTAMNFLTSWHYMKSRYPAGILACLGLYQAGILRGVAVFTNTRCREWDSRGRVWELSRFALRDDMPKNSESRFLGKLFKLLRPQIDFILAYSDPEFNHRGIIYKATGFKFLNQTNSRNDTFYLDDKRISARTIFDQYGTSSIPKLKKVLANRLKTRTRLGKLCFIKELKRNKKWNLKPVPRPPEKTD